METVFNRDKFDEYGVQDASKLKLKPVKSDNQQLYLLMEDKYEEIDKSSLMVFDFVDNASQYNMPYSLHRLFRLKDYHAGGLVAAPMAQKTAEEGLYAKGERPDALVDYPVDATDYELVDLFNWQEEAAGMLSQMEFVRRVDVQTETVERYVREGMILPDSVVPMSEYRTFKYFKEETLQAAAAKYGWTLIDDSNRKEHTKNAKTLPYLL